MIKIQVKNRLFQEAKIQAAYKFGFERAAKHLTKELIRGLTTGARSGRTYVVRGVRYKASAPGEMPAKRTGKLAGSVESSASNLSLIFGDTEEYGKYLEDGTTKMKPRPHVRVIGEVKGIEAFLILNETIRKAVL